LAYSVDDSCRPNWGNILREPKKVAGKFHNIAVCFSGLLCLCIWPSG